MPDLVTVFCPVWIGRPVKQLRDVAPLPPCPRGGGNESGTWPSGHGDGDLLALLDAADKIRSILTQFSEPDGIHTSI